MSELLSDDEHRAVELLASVAKQFRKFCSGKDLTEAFAHIHDLQNMVLAQAAARAYPEKYRLMFPPDDLPPSHFSKSAEQEINR